jgi:hypothetical protein
VNPNNQPEHAPPPPTFRRQVGNDYISGLGATKGQMVQVNLTASTSLHSVEEFKNLIVKQTEALTRGEGVAVEPIHSFFVTKSTLAG